MEMKANIVNIKIHYPILLRISIYELSMILEKSIIDDEPLTAVEYRETVTNVREIKY